MSPQVVSVVGARPQFVKAAVTCKAMQEAGITQTLVHKVSTTTAR